MSLTKRLRSLLLVLLSVAFVVTLCLLFYVDRGSFGQLQNLAERLSSSDKARQQVEVGQKGQDLLRPLASQIEERRDDLISAVQNLADDSGVKAIYAASNPATASSASNAKARPENLDQILKRVASSKNGFWLSAVLTDKAGKVIAAWGDAKAGSSLAGENIFKQLKDPAWLLGQPAYDFSRKEGKPAQSLLVMACGIEGKNSDFAGLVQVLVKAEGLLGLDPQRTLKSLKTLTPKGAVLLMRGTGDQVYHSGKPAYSENFSNLPDLKSSMASMQLQSAGREAVKSYDGRPGLLVWKRVGAWSEGQGPTGLLNLVAFLPEDDFKTANAVAVDKPKPFFANVLVWLLLMLAFGLPFGLGILLLPRHTEGLERTLETAGQIDEFGVAPGGLEFRDEADDALQRVNQSLNALLKRTASSEHRAQELDAALRRVEDQASKDATSAAQELSELRSRLGGADAEKNAANAKFDAVQKARQEIDAQMTNLKSALETSQRSIDLKNSESKNLSAQVQDLMRTLEEQRKVAQQAQENGMRRDDELVRLSAVNTLAGELKATLTVIKNYISTMLGSVGAISDAQQEFLGVVINKSARLERLISDLVELSEIGSGIKPPRMEAIAVSSLVQEALLNTRPQADHKRIALEFAESGTLPNVSVDREKMDGVFRTLLSQAVKVTSRGEKVTILLAGRDNAVELRFSDPGMSLPPDRSAKVFNQFHGVDSQSGPEFIGTGLRFPIMRAIVESHGGKIWIESQVGRGKTFVISLPKAGAFTPPAPRSFAAGESSPAAGPPPLAPPAPKPNVGDVAKFDSIFGDMPVPAGVGAPAPPPPGVKPLPSLPSLAPPAPAAAVVKPLPQLPGLPALPSLPSVKVAAASPPPPPGALPPLTFKTDAAKTPLKEEDKSGFDAIFGAVPAQAAEAAQKPGGLPKVELKTNATLKEEDKASFDAIFGGAGQLPPPPPPPSSAPKPALPASELSNFDAIFGGGAPAGAAASPPPSAPKAALPAAELSNFDAIFGGAPQGSLPPPPPPPPAPLKAPEGGLNSMDDLNNMLKGF